MTSTKMEVNMLDYAVFPFYLMACAVSLGLLGSTFLGFDMSASFNIGAGHAFSVANIAAIGILGYVAYTNDWDGGAVFNGIQGWLVLATVGVLIAPPFFPLVADTIAAGPAAIVALAVQAGGFITFSYFG